MYLISFLSNFNQNNYIIVLTTLLVVIVFLSLLILFKNKKIKSITKELSELDKKDNIFQTLFEKMPVGISIIKNYNEVLYANDKQIEITGKKREDFTGKTWMKLTHPDDLKKDMDLFEKFKSGELSGYSMEKRYMNADEDYKWVKLTIHPLDMTGKDKIYIALLEDIDEEKKAKKDLIESERNKSILLSNLPGIAYRCSFDREWTMEYISEGCYNLTGYKEKEIINNKKISYKDLISEEYRERVWKKWVYAVDNKEKFVYEYPIITADNEEKWLFEQGQAIYNNKGEVEALEGLIIDITERKKKEQEIEYLNNHDYLTGLYNRRYLEKVKGEYNKKEYHPISIIVCDINGLKLINDAFGEKKGDEFITTAAESLKKHKTDVGVLARTGGDDFTFIIPNTDKEENGKIVEKIRKEFTDKNINISRKKYSINISIGYCTKVNEKSSIEDAVTEAEDFMRKRKILEGKSSQNAILSSIKATMYEKSQETEEHAERLVYYARKIGKKMDLSQDTIDDLVLSANLHDLGKVGIDNQILIKEEKLSDEEWEEIKKHPEIGYRIAISSPDIAHIAEYILCHHEKWDGTGYPQGLKKEEIPLISRILSIVDAYDAMTSVRPYNIVKSKGEALQEIKLFSGKQFDPKLADIFTEILEREIEDED